MQSTRENNSGFGVELIRVELDHPGEHWVAGPGIGVFSAHIVVSLPIDSGAWVVAVSLWDTHGEPWTDVVPGNHYASKESALAAGMEIAQSMHNKIVAPAERNRS